ncbi:hypothetical protein [Saccharicrinis aurantiacus]|uniref:hypothetical protein n=1 Tax=Saccharicrinis aurantiacus TaxID=1849719 RepID=UPI0024936A45|nr:hypothetical protein [Saccharicrinis aurantiacus]
MLIKRFDYFYYRVYAAYKYSTKERFPDIPACCATALVQMLNILSIIFFSCAMFNLDYDFNKVHIGVLCVFLIIFNNIRYRNERSFYFLEKDWEHESRREKVKNGYVIVGYIIASLVIVVLITVNFDEIKYLGVNFK